MKKKKYKGEDLNAAAINYFDSVARTSRGEYDGRSPRGLKAKIIEYSIAFDMLSDIDIADKRILDAGCGHGRAIARLAERSANIIGMDASISMLRICQRKFRNEEVDLILADVEHIALKKQSFDVVLCLDTLQYFTSVSRAAVLGNLIDLVTPGGRIITDAKNSWCPYYRFKRSDIFAQYYSTHSITRVLKNRGCRNIRMKGIYFPTVISPIVVIKADIPPQRPQW